MKLAALAVFAVALLAASPHAQAHATLASSSPADGATVEGKVTQIKLQFSQAVRLTLVRVTPQDADPVEPASALPAAFVETVEVDVPALAPGEYDAQWTAVAQDGHVMTGAFSFTVTD
jgi:methionine-rich copper-binding protein CopC